MKHVLAGRRALVGLLAVIAALCAASSAWAHATMSPPVAKAKTLQTFTLAVPTEKEGATTTKIELTPPSGFAIDSFAPAPGWQRTVAQTGSGEEATITKVTWSGGKVPTEEDAVFQFIASPTSAKDYVFDVRQTYSDGSIVNWTGPESSDSPAPVVSARSSFGGGTSVLAIVAVALAAVALVVAVAGLVGRGSSGGAGRRLA